MNIFRKIKNIKENLGLIYRVFGIYRYKVLFLTLLGFSSSLLEGLGIGVLVPIFSFITGKDTLGGDIVSRNIGVAFTYFDIKSGLAPLLVLICSLFILKAILRLGFGYVSTMMLANFELEMRKKIYRNSLTASWGYLLKQKVGDMQHLLLSHLNYTFVSLKSVANNITDIAGFFVYVTMALLLSPLITAATVVGGLVFLLVNNPLSAKIKNLAEKRTKAAFAIAGYVTENALGLKSIKSMNLEGRVSDAADYFFVKFTKARKALTFVKAITSVILEPFSVVFIAGVFAVAYKFSSFDIGVFVATVYLIHKTFVYFGKIQEALNELNDTIPYIKSINKLQEEIAQNEEKFYGAGKFEFQKELSFKDVSFAYIADKYVLNKTNFTIKKGEMAGIIGPSGVGKTTVVDLLLRLFEVREGAILLDGVDVREISLAEWRRNIGYVAQDMFLKNDTVRNNIRFFDAGITDEAIVAAAKLVGADEFIEKLPQGFETVVGERGVLLSGGQKQRIVLSRIMARNPKIIVFDEATSALDNESEAMIKKTIEDLKGDVTIIAIAHRLSTVMSADRLLVLGEGRVLETGSPAELLANEDSYFYKVSNLN